MQPISLLSPHPLAASLLPSKAPPSLPGPWVKGQSQEEKQAVHCQESRVRWGGTSPWQEGDFRNLSPLQWLALMWELAEYFSKLCGGKQSNLQGLSKTEKNLISCYCLWLSIGRHNHNLGPQCPWHWGKGNSCTICSTTYKGETNSKWLHLSSHFIGGIRPRSGLLKLTVQGTECSSPGSQLIS